ncbi:hypothetical protein ABI_08760 [Asticcacaulis biprosthecium C19]|uniref:Uncharacterized protein n=1 Tax=Asticcacaulis biprosthecium C19 TaxID=715226 RepID=F4QGB2_9CAUL|nr:hypothetical protein ABI_08760 [Asticcacaulis biprosthecium C19]
MNEDLRLAILRYLSGFASYTLSVSMLHRALVASREFHVTADQVMANAEWLRDTGLADIEDLGRGKFNVIALPAGREVAAGLATRRGVTPYDPSQG